MLTIILFLLVCLTLLHTGHTSTHPHENKLEKPLFVPTFNYATLVHLNPLSYGSQSLENAAIYPQYVYDHGTQEYIDPLQRQLPYQDVEKRLQSFLNIGAKGNNSAKKYSNYEHSDSAAAAVAVSEDDYKLKPNNIQSYDELRQQLPTAAAAAAAFEFEDLEQRKFKRSLSYPSAAASWIPPPPPPATQTSSSSSNANERISASSNSRAVNVPFGPYTTWLPYEGPSLSSYAAASPSSSSSSASYSRTVKGASAAAKKSSRRRRRRDLLLEDNHLPDTNVVDVENLLHPQPYSIPVSIAYPPPPPFVRTIPVFSPPELPYMGELTLSGSPAHDITMAEEFAAVPIELMQTT